ncbi:DUF6221 family protein [Nocardioides sp. NPDC101246]|uniref:DUF6221 family protein n=1 Tax=Nocardioides sp. NPDC101246 TaxID=3364336 RepID=UPI0037F2195B
MTITEFLLARIAEDEAAARAAAHDGERWRTLKEDYRLAVAIDNGMKWGGETVAYDEGRPSEEQSAHIARHDPARVLAECEAKRRIVERCRPMYAVAFRESERLLAEAFDQERFQITASSSSPIWPFAAAERILLDLAQSFADHPDFDPAWRL